MSDPNSEINNGSVSAFLLQFAITGGTLLVFFSAFCVLRPRNGIIYQSRLKLEPSHDYPDLGKGLFGWIWKLIRIPESKVVECAGYDAAIYQRLSLLGVQIFAFCSIYGLLVLLPVYITACDGSNCQSGLNRLSMSNVPQNSNAVMIAPMISVYIFSLFAYWILHRAYRDFQALRLHFLAQRQPYSYTCMIKEMPAEDANDEALTKLFNFTTNGNVDYAAVGRNCKDLQKAFDRRQFYVQKLERALWDFNNSPDKIRPQHKTGFMGWTGAKVDSIEFYTQKLEKYNTRVADLQAANPPTSETGFVTFKNLTSAAAAPQLLYSNNTAEYSITAAPHPDDVYWPNMTSFGKELLVRRLIVTATVIFLVFFYTIPVAFIQSFMNMETLAEIFGQGFVDFINSVPGLQAVLEGILPTLAMTIFMALLPPLCYWLSIFEGWKSFSGLERQQLIKLYYFQLFNVFLITALSGSVLNQMQSIIENPSSIINSLAVGLPNSANFFINYVMLLAFGGWGAALLQVVRLVMVWIKLKWLAKTPREREAAMNPGPFRYSAAYGVDLLVWAIGFTYATIAPIILPFVVTYFAFGGFTNKYMTMYVSMPLYESGGRFFPIVFNRILVGMFVYQVMMFGIFSIKKSWIAFALIPLPFVTLLFYWLENKFWYMPSKYMPLKLAREMDDANQDAGETGEDAVDSLDRKKYLQPCLRAKPLAPETWDQGAKPSFEKDEGKGESEEKSTQEDLGAPAPSDVQVIDGEDTAPAAANKSKKQEEPQAIDV